MTGPPAPFKRCGSSYKTHVDFFCRIPHTFSGLEMVMTNSGASLTGREEAQALSLFELAQVLSAFFTGMLALTYISGYLTTMSYLGTFGIPADASEFFRAKYLYTGFDFWLFVAAFGALFYLGNSITNAFKTPEPKGEDEKRVVTALRWRERHPALAGEPWRNARWAVVIALITCVFSVELLLMSSDDFRRLLPLQALFLLSLALYQATFYREYSTDSYAWGLVHGRKLVRWIRVVFAIVIPSFFAFTMLLEALRHSVPKSDGIFFAGFGSFYARADQFRASARYWYWADLFIVLIFLVASFVTLGVHHLRWTDDLILNSSFRPARRGNRRLRIVFKRFVEMGFPLLLISSAFVKFDHVYVWARGIQGYARLGFFLPVYGLLLVVMLWLLAQLAYLIRKLTVRWNDSDAFGRAAARIAFGLFGWIFVAAAVHESMWQFCTDVVKRRRLTARRLFSRFFDTIGFAGLISGYCYFAFWVLHHRNDSVSALVFGYLTLFCALTVLTNMLWLTWKVYLRNVKLGPKIRPKNRTMPPSAPTRWQIAIRLFVPVTVLYLVSVLSFAHLIYPFIPVDKAGGDYASTSPVRLLLRDQSSECSSQALLTLMGSLQNSTNSSLVKSQISGLRSASALDSPVFYVLEENAQFLYLAPSSSAGGPKCWRLGPFCEAEAKSKFRPRVFEINQACVAAVEDLQSGGE